MIVVAVVCPPAPLLVPGLADRLAARAAELSAACDRAVRSLRGADRVLIVSAGNGPEAGVTLSPGQPVGAAGLARSDLDVVPPVRLPGGDPSGDGATTGMAGPVSVGSAVGAHLIARSGITAPTGAAQVGPGSGALPEVVAMPGRVGLLVMADGAACHGEHAPGAPDPRAEAFDADLVTALRSGDPATVAATCRRLAGPAPALRADSLPALAASAELTAGNGPARAELLHYSAPFGVGYPVAVWKWDLA